MVKAENENGTSNANWSASSAFLVHQMENEIKILLFSVVYYAIHRSQYVCLLFTCDVNVGNSPFFCLA